MSNYDLTIETS